MNEAALRKRNFYTILFEGVLFLSAVSFLDQNAIIPVFIFAYTQSYQLAGLATTLNTASSILAQTLVGPYVNGISDMPRYVKRIMFLFRPLPLLLIPILFLNLNPYLTVGLFLTIYALLWFSDGLIVVPWGDVFARTVAAQRRGQLLGVQQLLGGAGSLAAGLLIKFALENTAISDAHRFSLIFGCAAILLIAATFIFSFTKDLPRMPARDKPNPLYYYRRLPHYFMKNRDFAKMAYVRMLYSVTAMISPFLILFGENLLGLNAAQVSTLIYIQIIGSLIGGIVWGWISSRFGNKAVVVTVQIVSLFLPALSLALLIFQGLSFPYCALWLIVLINGMIKGSWLGYMNYAMDVSTDEDRTIYLLLNSLITFPLTVLSFLAGVIADAWGFMPLFLISMASAALAVVLSFRLKSCGEIGKAA